ncbi:MAG TPA: M90 family metallopeptidase [Chitinophagaceae bacterium]
MDIIITVLIAIALTILLVAFFLTRKKKILPPLPLAENYRQLLVEHVVFYNQLNDAEKKSFESRVQHFLLRVKITGVKTLVEDLDKVLIAASAIIPIFGFPDWEYINLDEVLLYPDSFNHEFDQQGEGRTILGMVGDGAYEDVMILSQHQLRQGFSNKTGKTNTAIHEFVHLLDKTDGSVDGVPESLVSRQYVLPWVQLMHSEIKKILANRSDINPYGATNEAEFFAVVSEYFFERPDLLQDKHPELYQLLVTIFKQQPPEPVSN